MQRIGTEAQHSSSSRAENFCEKTRHWNTTMQAKIKTHDKKFTGAATHEKSQDEVFLQTANIPLEINGEVFHVRGVLDSASQNNLITEAAVQRLR